MCGLKYEMDEEVETRGERRANKRKKKRHAPIRHLEPTIRPLSYRKLRKLKDKHVSSDSEDEGW